MVQHLACLGEWGYPFDLVDVGMFAKQVLSEEGRVVRQFNDNLPSKNWARLFLKRNNETINFQGCQNLTPTNASLSSKDITSFLTNPQQSLVVANEDGVPQQNCFSYDETNLSDDPETKKCVFKRSTMNPERIHSSSKAAVSWMCCESANDQILPPYVVYKSDHLIWTTWTEAGSQNDRCNRSKGG